MSPNTSFKKKVPRLAQLAAIHLSDSITFTQTGFPVWSPYKKRLSRKLQNTPMLIELIEKTKTKKTVIW